MHRLRILHVSDLHERAELDWMNEDRKQKIRNGAAARNRVLEESNFHDIIRKLRDSGRIDLVCFTGDIADWGLEAEYSLATERIKAILAASGVSRDRMFLVPGNHDVQRKKHEKVWKKLRELAMRRPDDCSGWMAGLSAPDGTSPDWRDAITERTSAFWTWVERELARPELCPWKNPHGRLGYRANVQVDLPFPIHVIGLDSAWLAGDDNDARKLRITDLQIDRLARDNRGKRLGGFRIALVHHPLSDLFDERAAINRLSETVDLVLHGHQHDPLAEVRSDPDRSLRVLAAGSLYEGDEGDRWINGFQAIDAELNDDGRPTRYEVRFWSWSKSGHWYPSGAIYRSAPNGILSIELGGAPARESTPPPDPQWYFIPRTELFKESKDKLLDNRKTIALVGMPGAGKSILASDLARDPEVQSAFSQVFWLRLGQDRALLMPQVRDLLYSLGDARPPAEDLEEYSRRLKEILRNRAVLLVADDAWRFEDVRPLLQPGPSKVLLTTRDWTIAERADAWKTTVEPFSEEEAVAMVEKRLDRKLQGRDREDAGKVAELVGRLPLSLAAACARFEETNSWRALLSDLGDQMRRPRALETPEKDAPNARLSVAEAFDLSVAQLDENDSRAFALLSALAEEVTFTSDVAMNLWHLPQEDAEARLRRLRRKELLRATPSERKPTYQLHDEQRNAGKRLLGLSPMQSHRRLLDEYQKGNPELARIPDDGYIHDHLAWHLIEADLSSELHQILRDERNGANVWFFARHFGGYLDDLRTAAIAASDAAGLEARYAMIGSSVASLGANVSFGLLSELVKRRIWSEERAWAHAISLPARSRRVVLKLFMEVFDGPFRERCFMLHMEDIVAAADEEKPVLLINVPHVLSHGQMELLLELAKRVKTQRSIAIIVVLAHFATAERIEEMFRELDALEQTNLGMRHGVPLTMQNLVSGLPRFSSAATTERLLARFPGDISLNCSAALRLAELGELDRALSIAEGSPYNDVLGQMAKYLRDRGDLLERAATAAMNIKHEPSAARALAAIYACYPEPRRSEHLKRLWKKSSRDARSLTVPFLSSDIVRDLEFPMSDSGKRELVERLVSLKLTDRLMELLVPASRLLSTELSIAADALSDSDLVRLGANDPQSDPWVLGALLPHWARRGHVTEAMALLPRVRMERMEFDRCMDKLSPHLDDDSLIRALSICNAIEDQKPLIRCLIELAASAPDELEADLLALPVETILDHQSLHDVARRLPLPVAAKLRASLLSPVYRLAAATAHKPPAGETLIDDLLSAVEHIEKRLAETKYLGLASDEVYRDLRFALDYFVRALEISAPEDRQNVFDLGRRALGPFGVGAMKAWLTFYPAEDVVAEVLRPRDGAPDARLLCSLAALLEGESQREIEDRFVDCFAVDDAFGFVDTVADVKNVSARVLDLAFERSQTIRGTLGLNGLSLVEHLASAGRIADAVAVAARVGNPLGAVRAQVALAAHAPPSAVFTYLDEAWGIIFRDEYIHRNWNDAKHLRPLIPVVIEQPKEVIESLWRRALRVLSRQRRHDMFEHLAPLSPMIRRLGGTEAVVDAYRAAQDVARWWP